MPNRDIHNFVAEMILGKGKLPTYNAVNKAMDFPSRFVGPTHRKYFHDPETLCVLAAFGTDAFMSGLLHLCVDENPIMQLAAMIAKGDFKNPDIFKCLGRIR